MEERTLSLCNMTTEIVLRELNGRGRNNSLVKILKIMNSEIRLFNGHTLIDFRNLIHLDITRCHIEEFNKSVFNALNRLNYINLSSNAIAFIDPDLFCANRNLRTVILKHNLLVNIPKSVFSLLVHLEILDLSYNKILVLVDQFAKCFNLKQLYLNHNRIKCILPVSFNTLPNLTDLILNDNQIEKLGEHIFVNLLNLRHLRLNDNVIKEINVQTFSELRNLRVLNLAGNLLASKRNNQQILLRNVNLTDLDLSNNIHFVCSLHNCIHLKYLKLMISKTFDLNRLEHLKFLTELEIGSNRKSFSWTYNFRNGIENLTSLTVLKSVFLSLTDIRLCNFSLLKKLEYLHIECMEPSSRIHGFGLDKVFPDSPQLKHLVLKKLNNFRIFQYNGELHSVKHLNLCGLKGVISNNFFQYTFLLEYLNLSFSTIEIISEQLFENLVNLEHLELQFSKLKIIRSTGFRYNRKLEVLNCSNCYLETIEEGSFSNLPRLKQLNLSNNILLEISDNLFHGIDREMCVITL